MLWRLNREVGPSREQPTTREMEGMLETRMIEVGFIAPVTTRAARRPGWSWE
jgi:hypothetical protein